MLPPLGLLAADHGFGLVVRAAKILRTLKGNRGGHMSASKNTRSRGAGTVRPLDMRQCPQPFDQGHHSRRGYLSQAGRS
jgi:hypothetical protein